MLRHEAVPLAVPRAEQHQGMVKRARMPPANRPADDLRDQCADEYEDPRARPPGGDHEVGAGWPTRVESGAQAPG